MHIRGSPTPTPTRHLKTSSLTPYLFPPPLTDEHPHTYPKLPLVIFFICYCSRDFHVLLFSRVSLFPRFANFSISVLSTQVLSPRSSSLLNLPTQVLLCLRSLPLNSLSLSKLLSHTLSNRRKLTSMVSPGLSSLSPSSTQQALSFSHPRPCPHGSSRFPLALSNRQWWTSMVSPRLSSLSPSLIQQPLSPKSPSTHSRVSLRSLDANSATWATLRPSRSSHPTLVPLVTTRTSVLPRGGPPLRFGDEVKTSRRR